MKTLKYAVRFLSRSRSYTLINLLGLAFSLACCIILLRYIHREQTVDTHCVDRERVVVPLRGIGTNINISNLNLCDTAFIPDNRIIKKTRISFSRNDAVQYKGQNYFLKVFETDSCFLQMFHYKITEGTANLSAPDQAVITEECAKRIFGKESPIGKVISYDDRTFTVSGTIAQPSCKTSLNFDMLCAINHNFASVDLIQVLPDVDLEAVNEVSSIFRPFGEMKLMTNWKFLSLKDFYFNEPNNLRTIEGVFNFGSTDYLNILFIVAILLLFVGILNFVNLYMVYMMKRSKEYGIKKVYGLQKFSLFIQIWSENVLLAFWALMVAWLIIEITQVPVARLMECQMSYTLFDLQLSLGFLILMPLVTSIYPYIRYQYMSPITSMRSIATNRQSVATRMSFLAIQYIVTFVLTVFSLYLNKHFQFLVNTPTGFRSERILEVDLTLDQSTHFRHLEENIARAMLVCSKLDECPDIEMWSQCENLLNGMKVRMNFFNDKDESVEMYLINLSFNDIKMYGLELTEGKIDSTASILENLLLMNQSAMKALGYNHLEEAFIRSERDLGRISLSSQKVAHGTSLFPVTAIIKDYYDGHLTEGIKPMVVRYTGSGKNSYSTGNFHILVQEGKEKAVLDYLRSITMEIYGSDDIQYTWLSDQVKAIYDEDRQIATIYTIFALIAIAVSCLGLFGISLFDIRQRYREIAIRKVNGAGMKDLYKLLFRKYTIVLSISFFIAVPVAYYLIHTYTAGYVVKAPMGIGIFVIALMIVAFISFGTLYWQIRKAANIDPAKTIKTE